MTLTDPGVDVATLHPPRPAGTNQRTTAPDVVTVRGATRVFGHNAERVLALDGVDLTVRRGEMVSLLGAGPDFGPEDSGPEGCRACTRTDGVGARFRRF